jgi:hypothetical protein
MVALAPYLAITLQLFLGRLWWRAVPTHLFSVSLGHPHHLPGRWVALPCVVGILWSITDDGERGLRWIGVEGTGRCLRLRLFHCFVHYFGHHRENVPSLC